MATFEISAEPRSVIGKKVKLLRKDGITPGVIYGDRIDPVIIQLSTAKLLSLFRAGGKRGQIGVTVAGDTYQVIVKELQRHITRGDLVHVDFQKIVKGQKIEMDVILEMIGRSVPSVEGLGSDILALSSITVLTIPSKIPAKIVVDASAIQSPSDSITIADLVMPEGVEAAENPQRTVARFEYTASVESLETAEGGDLAALETIAEADADDEE